MIVDPKKNLKDKYFYNKLLIIVSLFCLLCFGTSIWLNTGGYVTHKKFYNLHEDIRFGPVFVPKGRTKIYEIKAHFSGDNSAVYLSGEVQDENGDALYEFGKELWHESGYDSDGYWSESERDLKAILTFSEPGTYIIQLNTEENRMNKISYVEFNCKKGSGIPHLMVGTNFLWPAILAFILINPLWVKEKLIKLNEILEEMSDD